MRWHSRDGEVGLSPGEIARLQHSQWLTRALAGDRDYPKIPLRAVGQGGFTRLMSTEHGRRLAERWWETALALVDDAD